MKPPKVWIGNLVDGAILKVKVYGSFERGVGNLYKCQLKLLGNDRNVFHSHQVIRVHIVSRFVVCRIMDKGWVFIIFKL